MLIILFGTIILSDIEYASFKTQKLNCLLGHLIELIGEKASSFSLTLVTDNAKIKKVINVTEQEFYPLTFDELIRQGKKSVEHC